MPCERWPLRFTPRAKDNSVPSASFYEGDTCAVARRGRGRRHCHRNARVSTICPVGNMRNPLFHWLEVEIIGTTRVDCQTSLLLPARALRSLRIPFKIDHERYVSDL